MLPLVESFSSQMQIRNVKDFLWDERDSTIGNLLSDYVTKISAFGKRCFMSNLRKIKKKNTVIYSPFHRWLDLIRFIFTLVILTVVTAGRTNDHTGLPSRVNRDLPQHWHLRFCPRYVATELRCQ
jgi:hypothetical protein